MISTRPVAIQKLASSAVPFSSIPHPIGREKAQKSQNKIQWDDPQIAQISRIQPIKSAQSGENLFCITILRFLLAPRRFLVHPQQKPLNRQATKNAKTKM
jgi:hypothetical protein